jgi:hypothetical protein
MLTVLGGLAERDLIRARTGEGRERTKARGVKMGRKPKLTPHQQVEAVKRSDEGEPIRGIARSYNVRDTTGGYMLDRFRAGEDALHAIEAAELGNISGSESSICNAISGATRSVSCDAAQWRDRARFFWRSAGGRATPF